MTEKIRLRKTLSIALFTLNLGLFGCNKMSYLGNTTTSVSSTTVNNNLPTVVATTSVLCDLTRQVAQQTINLICLTSPDTNPHLYQPSLEDRLAIDKAKLVFFNGYNFEPGLFKFIKASKNRAPKIAVSQRAVTKPLKLKENGENLPDPYIWHNAQNGVRMVEVISNNLSKVLPKNASYYKSNTQKIKKELTQLDTWIKSRIGSIPSNGRKLITIRNTMGYYANAYGLSYTSALAGISTTPSVAQEKALVQEIQQAKIPTIFAETQVNSNSVKSVAKQAKVNVSKRLLFVDNLGIPGSEGDTYQKMMVANTRTIVEGLGGTYLIFEPKVASLEINQQVQSRNGTGKSP